MTRYLNENDICLFSKIAGREISLPPSTQSDVYEERERHICNYLLIHDVITCLCLICFSHSLLIFYLFRSTQMIYVVVVIPILSFQFVYLPFKHTYIGELCLKANCADIIISHVLTQASINYAWKICLLVYIVGERKYSYYFYSLAFKIAV
jgi:hypothetical protein